MDFEETTLQKELREIARNFAVKEIRPFVNDDERNEIFRPEIIQKLGQLGLTAIPIPEEFGGAGLGYPEAIVVIEELGAVSTTYAVSIVTTALTQLILNRYGTLEQKKKYIPPLASGVAIGAFAMSESGAGSDAASLLTTARREDDHFVLNGTKHWCTQGDIASYFIIMARTGMAGPGGLSAFILEKDTPGFSLGKREKKMGWHGSHTMELVLNNVKIPASNLVGKEGGGFDIAMTALDSGRITVAANAIGVARTALEVAVKYAKERRQFGKAIGDFQGISFMLADMATQLEAARLLVQSAAHLIKPGDQPFSTSAAMAKLFATDMAMAVTTDAVQILGGAGYTQDFPVERLMREAKAMQIVEGTNQIQRLIIGRALTT